jgi:hypothetical protein
VESDHFSTKKTEALLAKELKVGQEATQRVGSVFWEAMIKICPKLGVLTYI